MVVIVGVIIALVAGVAFAIYKRKKKQP